MTYLRNKHYEDTVTYRTQQTLYIFNTYCRNYITLVSILMKSKLIIYPLSTLSSILYTSLYGVSKE